MKFDKRHSKETLLKEIERLNRKVRGVYEAGSNGIQHVGAANYASREHEALVNLDKAMDAKYVSTVQ